MYDITKRKQFSTVGELKELLNNIPNETPISITGAPANWFHTTEDESFICLDCEDLDVDYDEYVPSAENGDYGPSNPWDAPGMKPSDFI